MTNFDRAQIDRLATEVLTLIEISEARLLNWGFVSVQSDVRGQMEAMLSALPPASAALWAEAHAAGVTPDDVLTNLRDRQLIFPGRDRYRSRFAETVRLLYLLRQRFSPKDWLSAARLVSDMRIQIQRRRYPRRDVSPSDVLATVDQLGIPPLQRAAISEMLRGPNGEALHLAEFQREAIAYQLRALQDRGDRALVIGAGTGAGKTKAFYIPALAEVTAEINSSHSTKSLAIYPRIELLKDQLAEAFGECRKLDSLLHRQGKRPITIGAYYGDTPTSARAMLDSGYQNKGARWQLTGAGDGWIAPFMPCPNPECSRGELIWSRQDVQAEADDNQRGVYGNYVRLRCASCDTEVQEGLLLTRAQMLHQPPDLLFTTTEMLNRRLSRANEHALFGIGTAEPPRLVLLDEIHTYDGMTGAHVAYVLRRWRHARGYHPQRSLCIVGLSATLSQAEQFFARLTGIPPHHIFYISPREADLVEEGVEYNLVLKGDPASGTSLLSTSVQAVMLLARVLDTPFGPTGGAISNGAYGQKVFAFTDKLDVINRWYHIEQDAETRQTLSKHRQLPAGATTEDRRRRFEAGEYWRICELIGHDLEAPLILDLTTSQYRGVRPNANLVIATSTLEVGFNDPSVGAVVQHKAPRSMASFLQRKGRAGRTRAMRPWTVVIASAYGRDRWAFQHAESLFSPSLPPLDLPLENYYVRKIQAGYALMDWLASVMKRQGQSVDVWALLSSAERNRDQWSGRRRQTLANILAGVLGGARLDELRTHLRRALGLQEDERALDMILWGEPRPLLMEVIPTLLRQLESNWQRVEGGIAQPWRDTISVNPMPDFVPGNLFSALNLPDLALHIPDTPRQTGRRSGRSAQGANPSDQPMRDDQYMPLLQGMVEFAPGHVSKRYARSHLLKEAHWLALPDDAQLSRRVVALQHMSIEHDLIPRRVVLDDSEYLVYRPRAYTLSIIPESVKSTSNARLIWRSHFNPQSQGVIRSSGTGSEEVPSTNLPLTPSSPWRRLFRSISAYTQATGTWVEVNRLAVGVQVETRYERGNDVRRLLHFEDNGTPAALGFNLCADGIRFDLAPFNPQDVLSGPTWPQLQQHLCPEYLLYRLQHDIRIAEAGLSSFEISWLWQLELSMLVAVAISRGCDLRDAAAEVQLDRIRLARRTLDVIFQSQHIDDDNDDREGRLYQRLMERIQEEPVQEALRDIVPVLWSTPDNHLADWLRQCYAASLGAVLFAALVELVPDIEPDDLVMDVEDGAIWITEAAAGGIGLVTRLMEAITQRPRELDLQLLDTLRSCEREQLATQLSTVADLVDQGNAQLAQAFEAARAAVDLPSQEATRRALSRSLEENGLPATRELVVALNSKFLRPNSGPDTDVLIALLARHWKEAQRRLGCAIDLRVMAVSAPQIAEITVQMRQVLLRIGGEEVAADEAQVFNLLQSLLWLGCVDSCPDCIEGGQPFQNLVKPSRALIKALLDQSESSVTYGVSGWWEEALSFLATSSHCRIMCDQSDMGDLQIALVSLIASPVEVGYQLFYPFIERIERTSQRWAIDLAVRELSYS